MARSRNALFPTNMYISQGVHTPSCTYDIEIHSGRVPCKSRYVNAVLAWNFNTANTYFVLLCDNIRKEIGMSTCAIHIAGTFLLGIAGKIIHVIKK